MAGKPRGRMLGAAGAARPARWPPPAALLDDLIMQATVDACDEDERVAGLLCMLQEELKVPFEVEILGVAATVEKITATKCDEIVAVCRRGKATQAISVLELPLPKQRPQGAEWIEAYRRLVCLG